MYFIALAILYLLGFLIQATGDVFTNKYDEIKKIRYGKYFKIILGYHTNNE